MSEFNREIDSLVNQMDVLSQTPNDKINCEKLDELKRVRDQLLTIMGQKSGYMLAKADVELDKSGGGAVATAPLARTDTAPAPAAGSARTLPKGDRLDQKQPEASIFTTRGRAEKGSSASINPEDRDGSPCAGAQARLARAAD